MEGGKLQEMKLYPLSMGYDVDSKGKHPRETGSRIESRPVLADREEGEKIIGHVKRLSEVYNTRIEYKDGVGVVRI
jgi:hypothetical protein